jgi:type IV secretion system protein VirD4
MSTPWALSLRLSLLLSLCLSSFTIVASLIFLAGTGLLRTASYPYWKWWEYLITYPDQPVVRFWLLVSGVPAAVTAILFLVAFFYRQRNSGVAWASGLVTNSWRPRMNQREWPPARLPAPPIIGATDNYGHARWATEEEMRERWPMPRGGHGALAVGELYDPRLVKGPYRPRQMASWGPGGSAPILYDDCTVGSGHSVRIAGSGSGKTESLKLSLRTTWSGPTVVLDPKQTLGSELEKDRHRFGHRTVILNPDYASACGFDVLDFLDPNSTMLDPQIDDVVEWVCGETPEYSGADNSKYFTGAGKDIVRGLVSHMMADPTCPPEVKTLRTPRQIICESEDEFRRILQHIHNNSPSQRARQLVAFAAGEANDALRSIHYTAQRLTAWLSTECWADLVCGNNFRSADLMDGKTDVFLALPFQSLASEPAVARCILGALFNTMFQNKDPATRPVLFALDEVAQLRHFAPLSVAWTMGREYRIRLHLMYQSTGQITKQWGARGKLDLEEGAEWVAYAGVKSLETAKELAETLGDYPVVALSESSNTGTQGRAMEPRSRSRGNTITRSEMGRRRIRPEEIIELRQDAQLIFASSIRPMVCGLPLDYRRRERDRKR